MNPETNKNAEPTFLRIDPMTPDPAAAPAPNSRTNAAERSPGKSIGCRDQRNRSNRGTAKTIRFTASRTTQRPHGRPALDESGPDATRPDAGNGVLPLSCQDRSHGKFP
jgi:hypothetical protein